MEKWHDTWAGLSAGADFVVAASVLILMRRYTNGGFHDDCDHWHPSGLHYQWYGLSVLNEDEHHLSPDKGEAYTVCFDAIKVEIAKNNPAIIAVGPELCWSCTPNPLPFMKYFLNASNHADGLAPSLTSYHHGMNADGPTGICGLPLKLCYTIRMLNIFNSNPRDR